MGISHHAIFRSGRKCSERFRVATGSLVPLPKALKRDQDDRNRFGVRRCRQHMSHLRSLEVHGRNIPRHEAQRRIQLRQGHSRFLGGVEENSATRWPPTKAENCRLRFPILYRDFSILKIYGSFRKWGTLI